MLFKYFQNVKLLDVTKKRHLQVNCLILSVMKGQDKLSSTSLPGSTYSALIPTEQQPVLVGADWEDQQSLSARYWEVPATLPARALCQLFFPSTPDLSVCQFTTPYTDSTIKYSESVQTLYSQLIYTAAFRQNPKRIQTC